MESYVDVMSSGSDANFIIKNPFKGPKSYEENDSFSFYGREEETAEVFQLIRLNTLTLLYSQSGIGKSSLLRAGIMPVLRHNDYLPIYIRPNYGDHNLDFSHFIIDQIASSIEKMNSAVEFSDFAYSYNKPKLEESIYEYFNRSPFYKFILSENGEEATINRLTPVLIFDQFEEIFTIGSNNNNLYDFFKNELSYLIENNIPPKLIEKLSDKEPEEIEIKLLSYTNSVQNFRVVFSLREEYLSHLESISNYIPTIFHTKSRFRLNPFSKSIARDVILKISDYSFDEYLTDNVIILLSQKDEKISTRKKDEVEPFLLSLICFHLFPKIIIEDQETLQSISSINYKLVDNILERYYEDSLRNMPNIVKVFIEEELLTDKGNRTLHNADDAEKIVGKEWVDKLVNEFRLLRKEEFLDSQHLEIIHDRITPIIIESRSNRRAEEGKVELENAKRRQEEENERLNTQKLLELEKKQREKYEAETRELAIRLSKINEEKLEEVRQLTIKELEAKYLLEANTLREEYERKVRKLEEAHINELNIHETRHKELNEKLSVQIQKITNEYEEKIQALLERRDNEVETRVKELKDRYFEEKEQLKNDLENTKTNYNSVKDEYEKLRDFHTNEIYNLRSSLKGRTFIIYMVVSLFAAACIIFTLYYSYKSRDIESLTSENLKLKQDILYLSKDSSDKDFLATNYSLALKTIDRLRDSINTYSLGNGDIYDSLQSLKNRNMDLLSQINSKNIIIENNKLQIQSLTTKTNNSPASIYEEIDVLLDSIYNVSKSINKIPTRTIINSFQRGDYQIQESINKIDTLLEFRRRTNSSITGTDLNSIQLNIKTVERITLDRQDDISDALKNKLELEILLEEVTNSLQKISRKR